MASKNLIVNEIGKKIRKREKLLTDLEAALIRVTLNEEQRTRVSSALWSVVRGANADIEDMSHLWKFGLITRNEMDRLIARFEKLRDSAQRLIRMI